MSRDNNNRAGRPVRMLPYLDDLTIGQLCALRVRLYGEPAPDGSTVHTLVADLMKCEAAAVRRALNEAVDDGAIVLVPVGMEATSYDSNGNPVDMAYRAWVSPLSRADDGRVAA